MTLGLTALLLAAIAAPAADTRWIEAIGGFTERAPDGSVVEVSLAGTWATDNDVQRLTEWKTLKRLDLSFTYVTDRGIEQLKQLPQLEELTLDTAEFITDAAISYLRSNRNLHKLNLRGTD